MPTLTRQPVSESALIDSIEARGPSAPWLPEHEATTTEREFRLSVDLPGVLPEHIHASIHEGRLSVDGHRVPANLSRALDHTTTRRCGRFALDVAIPAWIDPKRAFQAFDGSILTVVLPRRRESRPSAHGPLDLATNAF